MRDIIQIITDLGDATLLVPASGLVIGYLFYLRTADTRKTARIWISTLALCAVLTVLLKVVFYTCGSDVSFFNIRNPSGHTSLSMTFYGCAALTMGGDKDRGTRIILLSAGLLIAGAVAVSRLALHFHTGGEVLVGLCIGIICLIWFGRRYFALSLISVRWLPVIVALAFVAFAMHGMHWNFEWLISEIAGLIRSRGSIC